MDKQRFTEAERQGIMERAREIVRAAEESRTQADELCAAAVARMSAARSDILDMERRVEVNRAADARERKLPPREPFDGGRP